MHSRNRFIKFNHRGMSMEELMGHAFRVRELAQYMGVSAVTVYRLVERGEIPARKIGGQWRFLKDEIDRWLRERW